MSKAASEVPTLAFASPRAWEAWLEEHHTLSNGIWLKFAKKASGIATVVYAEALDVALCVGWIDGLVKRLDETWYLQRFTPRRPRSKWSKINCNKVLALIEQIEAAKADGRWDAAYDPQSSAAVPDDLAAALKRNKKAAASFAALTARNRYSILYHIQEAKRPETRARRIATFVTKLAEGKKLHP